ncbi:MAG: glucose-6-phosphate dehydrogenase, partial [Nitrospirota bacterium]|nr:glucose-6-phosphate dehydrogenase [Nitrospirota bacterium]
MPTSTQPNPYGPSGKTTRTAVTQPCTIVIFGASGDLTRRKLLPALYNLLLDGLLPENFAVLGLGRKDLSDDDFRAIARNGIEQFSRQTFQTDKWEHFHTRLFYCAGDITASAYYEDIRARVSSIESQFHLPGNRMFYLAIPPGSFAPACEGLHQVGLVSHVDVAEVYSRVIVEKPIGHDLASAQKINTAIGN